MSDAASVHTVIRAAVQRSGLGKREIARRAWGDSERYRDLDRYMRDDGPKPGASAAVLLAAVLGEKPTAFLGATPLEAVASELAEVSQTVLSLDRRLESLEAQTAAGFESALGALAALASDVASLVQRSPSANEQTPP